MVQSTLHRLERPQSSNKHVDKLKHDQNIIDTDEEIFILLYQTISGQ